MLEWRVPFHQRSIAHLIEMDPWLSATLCAPGLIINTQLAAPERQLARSRRCVYCTRRSRGSK